MSEIRDDQHHAYKNTTAPGRKRLKAKGTEKGMAEKEERKWSNRTAFRPLAKSGAVPAKTWWGGPARHKKEMHALCVIRWAFGFVWSKLDGVLFRVAECITEWSISLRNRSSTRSTCRRRACSDAAPVSSEIRCWVRDRAIGQLTCLPLHLRKGSTGWSRPGPTYACNPAKGF